CEGTAFLAITPTSEVLVAERLPPAYASDKDILHHWLTPTSAPRGAERYVTHVSVAPLHHYDFVQKALYMGVIVGYSNGEVWFWLRIGRTFTFSIQESRMDSRELN